MKRTYLLEQATTPDGSTMSLHTHDGNYVIRVEGRELMSSRHAASEERLAVVACSPFIEAKNPQVLIGGLGLGFTLRAALATLPQKSRVFVAELMPEVVTWNKNPEYKLAAAELADPRTKIIIDDVANIIAKSPGDFHAIMLDADNGTTAMSSVGNRRLYEEIGLAQVIAALRPGGLVVYWSAQDEPLFKKRMMKAGLEVTIEKPRLHATSGGKHTLLIGRRP